MRSRPVDVDARDFKGGMIVDGKPEHGQAVRKRQADLALLDRMIPHRHKEHAIETQGLSAIFSQDQVPNLRRIESAAEYADALVCHSDHSNSKSPM